MLFQSAPLLLMWEVSFQYEKCENGWSEVSLHAKDCVPHYCVTRRSKTYFLYNSYLLFVFFVCQDTLRPGKERRKCEKGPKKILRKKNSIWLLFGRLYLVLGYGLFGIFNQETSHNIRKCFNILWISFTQCSLSDFPCGKLYVDLKKVSR